MTVHFWVSVCQGSGPIPLSLSPLQKERRLLQNRRLDLDACKARLKKAKAAEAKATVSAPDPSLLPGCWGVQGWGLRGPGVWHALPPWLGLDCADWSGHGVCPHPREPWWLQYRMYEVGRLTVPVPGLGTLLVSKNWDRMLACLSLPLWMLSLALPGYGSLTNCPPAA